MDDYDILLTGMKIYVDRYARFTEEDALELLNSSNAIPIYETEDGYILVDPDDTYYFI